MSIRRPFNFKKWIDENRHLLKPPVGNKVVYENTEFIVMVVGGPNSRKDYHYNESEEFFYQLEGDITVKVQEDGQSVEVPIKEGDIFLLPPKVPHNPVRGANTIGLVMERKRRDNEKDGLLWFCEKCNHKLYENYFTLTNIMTQFQETFKYFYENDDLKTCKNCSHKMEPPTPVVNPSNSEKPLAIAPMLTIDIHTHILPKDIPNWKDKFGYGGFIQLDHHKHCCARMVRDDGKFFREVEDNCWSAEKRIVECNHQHVDVQVLSTVPVMFSYWAKAQDTADLASFLNLHIADIVQRFPKKFIGLGTVPLQETTLAIKSLEHCKSIGLKGIQIGSNVNQLNLDEPQFFDFFAACQELDMALFIHPWEMMGEANMQKYWLPWLVGMPAETSRAICSLIFGGVFERLPQLRVAFAHGGGSFPSTIGRIEHGFDCRPDLVAINNKVNPRNYIGKFWFDSLVHDPAMLKYLVDFAGAHRVSLGSDYPFPLGENVPGTLIKNSDYNDETKALLLHGAALEWLQLNKATFT